MIRLIAIPFTLLAYIWYVFILCVFHPVQWISFNLFGYHAHKYSVDIMNFFLFSTLKILFTKTEFYNKDLIPEGKPLIIVANHQGMFDINGLGWYLRKFHPKFVSKIELGKGVPSISFNLRHGGSVLIDRKDPRQALPELMKLAEYIEHFNRSAIIFPEGTRSRNGKPKEFAPNGLKILCKYAPDAYVVPITINNSWKVFRYGSFPLGIFNSISFTVHPPLKVKEIDFNTIFHKTEKAIKEGIEV